MRQVPQTCLPSCGHFFPLPSTQNFLKRASNTSSQHFIGFRVPRGDSFDRLFISVHVGCILGDHDQIWWETGSKTVTGRKCKWVYGILTWIIYLSDAWLNFRVWENFTVFGHLTFQWEIFLSKETREHRKAQFDRFLLWSALRMIHKIFEKQFES